jgi:hypothetical protein
MARKPTPKGGKTGDDPLRLEKKRLLEAQQELIRKQEEARRLIEEAPRKLQELKKRQREPIVINLKTSRTGQKRFDTPHDKFSSVGDAPRRPRPRKAERNMAKLQFIVLCAILLFIAFMVWRAIPAAQ